MIKQVISFDDKLKKQWIYYILQSLLAMISVFAIFLILRQQNLVIAASLAATAFTVFTMPNAVTASNRNVIGGYLVGIAVGSFIALFPQNNGLYQDLFYALTVGLSMFLMTITNTEHPPAAGTALGLVISGYSTRVLLGTVIGISILVIIMSLLRHFLLDLIATKQTEDKA